MPDFQYFESANGVLYRSSSETVLENALPEDPNWSPSGMWSSLKERRGDDDLFESPLRSITRADLPVRLRPAVEGPNNA